MPRRDRGGDGTTVAVVRDGGGGDGKSRSDARAQGLVRGDARSRSTSRATHSALSPARARGTSRAVDTISRENFRLTDRDARDARFDIAQEAIFAAIPEKELRASDNAKRTSTNASGRDARARTVEGASAEARTKTNAEASTSPESSGKRAEAKVKTETEAKGKREPLPRPDYHVSCPRCKSDDTKFCYYNNYNIKQPRFYCKKCCRYWTEGGMLRNVSVGAGRRKSKGAKERIAAEKAAAGVSPDDDGVKVGAKRSRAASGELDANRSRGKATRTSKRDGSSDGSATEAEQGEGNSGYARGTGPWNGSNAASDTALRGRSPPEEQGSAEGSQQPAGAHAPFGWGIDPSVARYLSTGILPPSDEAMQAQAAAAAAASAAIMTEATRWGMQFWSKSMFPFNIPQQVGDFVSGPINAASSGNRSSTMTPISLAAMKFDRVSHPTPLHPVAAAAAASTYSAPRTQSSAPPIQYPSVFQNPWAQFSAQQEKGFHANPAVFQAMQQQMFNQQMAAHFFQQLHGAMQLPFGFNAMQPMDQARTSMQERAVKSEEEEQERGEKPK